MTRAHAPEPAGFRAPLVLLGAAAAVFLPALTVAAAEPPPDWELDLAEWINDAPGWLAGVLWPVMQLGTVWAPVVIGIAAAWWYGWRRGLAIVVSGVAAWFLAKVVKDIVERGRPLEYLPKINVREGSGTGLGFVSGHSAVAFAIATALMWVLPRWARVVAYALASLVGIARIIYGLHLPADVVGGACAGIMTACVVELLLRATQVRSLQNA
ncbi:MAG: phosphatase PAP2 family protein [Acidimicrobiia bacterium]